MWRKPLPTIVQVDGPERVGVVNKQKGTGQMSNLTELFGEPISVYLVAQAIEDGFMVDAAAVAPDVTAQHWGAAKVAFTPKLWGKIEKAVANKRHCNDYAGIVHDIFHMCKVYCGHKLKGGAEEIMWPVIITGAGRVRNHVLTGKVQAYDETGIPVLVMDWAEHLRMR